LCICLFFAGSIFMAVVGGVALSFLVPIDDPVLAQNKPVPFDNGPRPREDVGKRPLDIPPPNPFPNGGPPIDNGPRPGEFPQQPPPFELPPPPEPPPEPPPGRCSRNR
jgi:hypothetical protein